MIAKCETTCYQSLARRLSSLLPLITLGLVRLGALSLTGYHHVVIIHCDIILKQSVYGLLFFEW